MSDDEQPVSAFEPRPGETLPQPHEGIRGVDRSDDPIMSLSMESVVYRELIRTLAVHLYRATLVGDPAPVVRRMLDWMRHPQPGDLVMEHSTAYRSAENLKKPPGNWPWSRMGYLITVRREWMTTDEQWAEAKAEEAAWNREHLGDRLAFIEERSVEPKAWYIQYGPNPGDVCRWENCEFLAIPTELRQFDMQVGTRSEQGVMLNRDDVAGALTDSGFHLKGVGSADV
jgi:hypothetical protein